jgi:hypothetical protein
MSRTIAQSERTRKKKKLDNLARALIPCAPTQRESTYGTCVSTLELARGYTLATEKRVKKVEPKNPVSNLVKLEPIIEIVRAAIWTGRLSDEKPVSVMLVAEQESAKTEVLKYFRNTSTLLYLSDVTSKGLDTCKNDIEAGRLRHLVILDLVRILSHGRGVSERTIQTLASLMEEGESSIADAGGKATWKNFPRIGALMGITESFFKAKRGKWRQTGFLTRFIPVTFHYKPLTVDLIHKSISQGKKLPDPHMEPIPEFACQVKCDDKFSAEISMRSKTLGLEMKTYGFRYHRVLRALAKANARMNGRGWVKQEDIDTVIKWSEFFGDKVIEL